MKTFKRFFFLLVIGFIFLVGNRLIRDARAEACQGINDPNERISCLNSELDRLNSQSKTLSNQIAQFDAQIKLTLLKVAQTEEKITLLGGRINQLEGSLDSLSKAFASRAVETYKMARAGTGFFLLISSSDLSEAVSQFNYLKRVQEADRDLLTRLQTAQTTYKVEKTDQETLQAELAKQKANLDAQKKAKNALLAQTKNDEKTYQQLLAQAYAEKAAVEKALVAGTKVGPVRAGDPIALVGNTGYNSDPRYSCSTGKHLHFEIRKDGGWTDPAPFISSHAIINCQDYDCGYGKPPYYLTLGTGGWRWPIEDPIHVTQFYGKTPFSYRYEYSGGNHTGYDLVPESSDVIRAPADGTLYKSTQLCMGVTPMNIVYIDHGGGLISLYLHVQ